ncbi:hypothetical protein VTO73DRAFT_10938 [Trametes versicolor]
MIYALFVLYPTLNLHSSTIHIGLVSRPVLVMHPSPEDFADEVYDNGVVVELTLVAAAAALFCFDYSLTFAREVEHIWKREFSTTAVLFYFFRYLGLITTIFAVLAVAGWTGISPKLYVARSLHVCAMRGVTKKFTGIIGARSSAVLTDMIVLCITIWKARPVQVLSIASRLSVKSTVANILMRDGVLYFGVLLFTNLVGLILVWDFILILPLGIGTTILTAIMTCRFILDLREAADPRFNDLSTGGGGTSHLIFPNASTHAPCFDSLGTGNTSTDFPDPSSEDGKNTSGFAEYSHDAESESNTATVSGASTLIFPATSKHAPHFDSDLSFDIGAVAKADYYDAIDSDGRSAGATKCNNSERQWEIEPCLEAHVDGESLSAMASRCNDVESVIWIR